MTLDGELAELAAALKAAGFRLKPPKVMIPIEQVCARLRERKVGERIIARVKRLNPDGIEQGTEIRGIRPDRRVFYTMICGCLTRRMVEEKLGRGAWRAFPKIAFAKDGRRRYLKRTALMDRLDLLPADHEARLS